MSKNKIRIPLYGLKGYFLDDQGRICGKTRVLHVDKRGKVFVRTDKIVGCFDVNYLIKCHNDKIDVASPEQIAARAEKRLHTLKKKERRSVASANANSVEFAASGDDSDGGAVEELQAFMRRKGRKFLMALACKADGTPIYINGKRVSNFELAYCQCMFGKMKANDLIGLLKIAGANTESQIDDSKQAVTSDDPLMSLLAEFRD